MLEKGKRTFDMYSKKLKKRIRKWVNNWERILKFVKKYSYTYVLTQLFKVQNLEKVVIQFRFT